MQRRRGGMATRPTPRNAKRVAKNSDAPVKKFQQLMGRRSRLAASRWYGVNKDWPLEQSGGRWFYEWVKKNYRRMNGEKLIWKDPYFEPFYVTMGNPWIERVIVEKPAQTGYTESCIALMEFSTGIIGLQSAFGFEQQDKQFAMVGRIQKTVDQCDIINRIRQAKMDATQRKDADSSRVMTIGGVECNFFSANVRKAAGANQNERQAPSGISSWPCQIAMADEIELFAEGVIGEGGILEARMEASPLPTKIFRGGSTPGGEGGIVDREVRASGFLFEWMVKCDHCGHRQFLDPYGNLLKPVLVEDEHSGLEEAQFVDATGRPMSWWCHDETDTTSRIATAYVGCQNCGGELEHDVIAQGGYYCHADHDQELMDFGDRAMRDRKKVSCIAMRFPRLSQRRFSAPERISKLMHSRNPVDQIQQGLGKVASVGTGRINLKKIEQCIGRELPVWTLGQVPVKVLGVDQGKAHNWGIIQHWWMPPHRPEWDGLSEEELHNVRWMYAYKKIVWYGALFGMNGIERCAEEHDIDLVGMDQKPESGYAAGYAASHPTDPFRPQKGRVYLCDQVSLNGEMFAWRKTDIQGQEISVIRLDRTSGLDAVRDRIYRAQVSFPGNLEYKADEDNLIHHYLTSERNADGLWREPDGAPDHWFHADNFGEVAMLAQHFEPTGAAPFGFITVGKND